MRATRCLATMLLGLGACARGRAAPEPRPAPEPAKTPGAIGLATGWTGSYTLRRTDSIAITLPTGAVQRQVLGQAARFTIWVGQDAKVTIRLDSLRVTPVSATGMQDLVGATWTGTLSRQGLGPLRASRSDAFLGTLGEAVRSLFPSTPRGGILPEARWADTTETTRPVEAFTATDRRTSRWTAGTRTTRDGLTILPITLRAQFEQVGKGSQGGREMTMTAQGVRSSSYYVTMLGRVDQVVHRDSIAKFITIPAGRQTIPTTQIVRVELRALAPTTEP
ncbi:MAG TPA: hypothetical protein VFN90_05105 [Gemmatimonadales bacterium]|nr:hypothetical protein [Gemmatimonadales bacterium]